MLAFRRQHHQEIATDLTDRDATERRITELYTKAVEQLGSDKAPVRLGGLYALERLAQDNPAHRQTIVNVICAYLRMPFSPTPPASKPEPEATEDPGEPATETEAKTDGIGDTWQQERQVRLTAQRILAEHLRDDRAKDKRSTDPPSPRFWPGIRLDLAGATLIDFDLQDGVMADANFSGATFSGDAWFGGATFSGDACVRRGDLQRRRPVRRATFSGAAWFGGATFSGDATFGEASPPSTTSAPASRGLDASSEGDLQRRAFEASRAWFDGATFSGDAGSARPSAAAPVRQGDLQRVSSLSFERSRVLSPEPNMSGRRDGASGRTAAADTRLSARTTTVVPDLPGHYGLFQFSCTTWLLLAAARQPSAMPPWPSRMPCSPGPTPCGRTRRVPAQDCTVGG